MQNCFNVATQEELKQTVEIVQIMVPQKSSEPYRNVKNNGLLLDLESGIGETEERKETSPDAQERVEADMEEQYF